MLFYLLFSHGLTVSTLKSFLDTVPLFPLRYFFFGVRNLFIVFNCPFEPNPKIEPGEEEILVLEEEKK